MAAAAAAIALLVWVGATSSRFPSPTGAPPAMGGAVGIDEAEDPGPILAKPTDEPSAPMPSAAADGVSAPPDELSFYVVDAAGYAYTLSDLSGSVVVLGVFGQSGPSRQDIVRLYDSMPVDDQLQFIAVGLDETVPETVQGVPFMVNRGSTLVGTPAGEFAILTRDGSVYQRGSLSDARLEEVILTGLAELNIARGESEP